MKNISFFFIYENFPSLVVKFSMYLNRYVFVMTLVNKRFLFACAGPHVTIIVYNILPHQCRNTYHLFSTFPY